MAVKLDPGTEKWLDRVLSAAPHRTFDTASLLEAWLAWDPEPRSEDSQLAVHFGDRRVGVLDPADAEIYSADMDAAATRDELPYLWATLTKRRREPIFVLELAASSRG